MKLRLLLDHCDLPWEDAVLDFHKTRRGVLWVISTNSDAGTL